MGMSVEFFVQEYISIEKSPQSHHKKGQLLTQLMARHPRLDQTAFEELLLGLELIEGNEVQVRMPLFSELLYPVLVREIELGNPRAMLVMLEYIGLLNKYASWKKVYVYSEYGLIEQYLLCVPNDRDVLFRKKELIKRKLDFAVHELP